jgi:hypothetical protein
MFKVGKKLYVFTLIVFPLAYYFTTDVGKTPLKRKVTNTSVIRCIKNTPSSNSYL